VVSFFSSFFLIAVAELGDKTQLLALSFAAKYNPYKVLAGIFIGSIVIQLFSALIGRQISFFIPALYIKLLVGLSFIGFGLWTIRESDDGNGKEKAANRFGPVLTVALAFFIAELGDKTQLATISLAAEYRSFLGVWLGSTLGMVAADAVAVLIGVLAHKHLPVKLIKYFSAAIFIFFGLMIIYGAMS